ncbi:MAG: ParA family protein [Halothiobacillus sp.]
MPYHVGTFASVAGKLMAQIIALYSVKGGVGKTASVVNLAALSALQGRKVLLWDLDPQGAASWYLQAEPESAPKIQHLLKAKSVAAGLRPTKHRNLTVLPSDQRYHDMEHRLAEKKDAGFRIAKVLDGLTEDFDEIWIDTPPGITLLGDNVLRAANLVLVPIVPTHLSERTWFQLKTHLAAEKITPGKLAGFLAMVDRRRALHRDFRQTHLRDMPELMDIEIPYAAIVEHMGDSQAPIVFSHAKHPAAQAYFQLWQRADQALKKL